MLGQGCALVGRATDVVTFEMKDKLDEHRERARNRKWAEAAWKELAGTAPYDRCSEDFAAGFQDGFADYLYAGGPGTPPPLPPPQYRALRYQTPEGYRAVEDWFAGFRAGATAAQHGNYRQWIVGPTSGEPAAACPPHAPGPVPPGPPVVVPQPGPEETLPPPRKEVPPVGPAGHYYPPHWDSRYGGGAGSEPLPPG
jgi:hypothetical protein